MDCKLLVTSRSFGTVEDRSVKTLEKFGWKIDRATGEQFEDKILDYDALIIGAHDFPAKLMARCEKLKVICKHGAELDNIPLNEAKRMGIQVFNVPKVNTERVADLTFGLLLDVSRCISHTNAIVHRGIWKTATGTDVFGKTLGIIGYGAIGEAVARRAKGFGMKVMAYDPYISKLGADFEHVTLSDLDGVFMKSDFISINASLTDETRGLLTEKNLLKMKKGSYIINTAKGEIIDEFALYKLLESGHLAGAAMDVCTVEPMPLDNPLLDLENVIITPHIGVYTKEAIEKVSLECAKNIVNALNNANL